MDKLLRNCSIIACSTSSLSNSAIALIRISTHENISFLDNFFSLSLENLSPNSAKYCELKHPFTHEIFDQIILTYFKGPHSYTGENILELSIHGNKFNIDRVLNLFLEHSNLELARPGEFSLRALLNKKITLTQAEGLDELLNATSTYSLTNGLKNLKGELNKQYNQLRDHYLKIKAILEINIDFSHDIGQEQVNSLISNAFNEFNEFLVNLHSRTSNKFDVLNNPQIVLFGETNAGKSTFFNNYLKNDRSIISSEAGTTRDYISESINIDGNYFSLIDTAGVRVSDNLIENEGIKLSKKLINEAFFKILVINPHNFTKNLEIYTEYSYDLIVFSNSESAFNINDFKYLKFEYYMLCTKSGPIEPVCKSGPIGPKISAGPIEPDGKSGPIGPQKYSNNGPIEPLNNINNFNYLDCFITKKLEKLTSENPILNLRHQDIISTIYNDWTEIYNSGSIESDIALLSHKINMLEPHLDSLIGVTPAEDVLNHVFSNFCIGK